MYLDILDKAIWVIPVHVIILKSDGGQINLNNNI